MFPYCQKPCPAATLILHLCSEGLFLSWGCCPSPPMFLLKKWFVMCVAREGIWYQICIHFQCGDKTPIGLGTPSHVHFARHHLVKWLGRKQKVCRYCWAACFGSRGLEPNPGRDLASTAPWVAVVVEGGGRAALTCGDPWSTAPGSTS